MRIDYDDPLAHLIEAGADLFLMPSRYEPCGLNQMYSLRYGTVPVVRATGGLDDTIKEGTGFKFRDFTAEAMLRALEEARTAYADPARWTAIDAPRHARGFFLARLLGPVCRTVSAPGGVEATAGYKHLITCREQTSKWRVKIH